MNRKQLRRGQTYTLFIDPNSPGVRTGVDSALDASWFTLSVGERPSKAEYGEYVLELGLLLLLLLCLARNRVEERDNGRTLVQICPFFSVRLGVDSADYGEGMN